MELGGELNTQVLALHAPGQNNLAAAFYDPETRKLQILEDTKDTWGWDLGALCPSLGAFSN